MIKVTLNKKTSGSDRLLECREGDRMRNEWGSLTRDSILGHWEYMGCPNLLSYLGPHFHSILIYSLLHVMNADLVLSRVLCSLLVIFSMALCLLLGGSRSTLFRTTTIRGQVSSPISRHSAVWVCTPFTTSTTSIIRSMIWAPRESRNANNYQNYNTVICC